ncbi:MAG: hypothetical protein RJB14_2945 [Pseudomonadota bacterium]|jgi:methyl-accepting chemotaxis protein
MSENTFTPDAPLENTSAAPEDAPTPKPDASTSESAAKKQSPESAPSAPVHTGLSVDQRAYQQYQSLAQLVLDSADLATKSAEAAASASSHLRKTTTEFKELTEDGHKKARLLMIISGSVLIVCLIFFLIMGIRLVSRINQLDTMMLAVGKRVVELNAGMESLEGVNQTVKELAAQQAALTKSQGEIEGRIEASLKQSENLVQKVPGETAKQVAASSDSVIKQVQGINAKLQSQASAVQTLGNEVKSLKSSVGNVDGLKRDVEALVTLQKERYLEALQKNNTSSSRDRAVQFPRYVAPKPADGTANANQAPATNSPSTPATKP